MARKTWNQKSKYLGKTGKRLVHQLFIEHAGIGENDYAVYTFEREAKDGYPSLYKLYMETADITEGRFVEEYLYDWEQWETLANHQMFGSEITQWRKELKASILSTLMDALMVDAASESKTAISTARYLVDKLDGKKAPTKRVGRPSKQMTGDDDMKTIAEDVQRLRLIKT